jgi:teichoic acid transport system ATP-binding protein
MDDILSFADIGDFVYQPVKSYSSGMFVRLAFAVAINIDPEILIVDEALSVGDVFFQAKCYKKFEDFKKQGKTILFVSHDLSSIRKYCDRVILFNKGQKLAEGEPKEMIDLYKKILTGSKEDIEKAEKLGADALTDKSKDGFDNADADKWSSHFSINPDRVVYGSKEVEIVDFGIEDETGNLTSVLSKDADFVIKYKVRFNEKVKNPIFTYTFKNVKGLEVTGTNTLIERSYLEEGEPGEEYTVSFKQNMNLQGGDYLLSMSCTGYDLEGNLKAYHRCYDLLSVTVISDKDTVGFYDMYSKVEITKN